MRNEILHGYLIHARKYRERSHIVHFFSVEYGRIDGVLRQSIPPLFQPVQLQASGRSELKSFSKVEIDQQPLFLQGNALFCGFYLNELLLKLCVLEDPYPKTYQKYHYTIHQLQYLASYLDDPLFLKKLLRQFEHVLFTELGYEIDFSVDHQGQAIDPNIVYLFEMGKGFYPQKHTNAFAGSDILAMHYIDIQSDLNLEQLNMLGKLYRQIISALLGDRQLKSRQLWIQHHQTKII